MIQRHAATAICLALLTCPVLSTTASASVIGLSSPVSGNANAGDLYTLTVGYDPNGTLAPNLVSMELFVGFTGLAPVGGSYALGPLFGSFAEFDPDTFLGDRLSGDELCGDSTCAPAGAPAASSYYHSYATLFAPAAITSGGTLFSLQFIAPASTAWTLDVLTDSEFGLQSDPPTDCVPTPADECVAPRSIPFAVVLANAAVNPGTARITVAIDGPPAGPSPDPTPIPEPGTLLLLGSGIAALTARARRRSRA